MTPAGARVDRVDPSGAAQRSGIRRGDLILAVDDVYIRALTASFEPLRRDLIERASLSFSFATGGTCTMCMCAPATDFSKRKTSGGEHARTPKRRC
jgi:hypothetical protein